MRWFAIRPPRALGRRYPEALAALVVGLAVPACSRDSEPSSPSPEDEEGPTPGPEEMNPLVPAPVGMDADRVAKLFPDGVGSEFRLGDTNPNADDGLSIEEGLVAVPGTEGGVRFWTVETYDFEYSEGGTEGKTARLHISSAGAQQRFDWQTQTGFLAGPEDLGDQEFTAYVRVHGIFDPERAAFELKIRGGQHSDGEPALASCTMMTFATADAPGVSRFGKELNHPEYDYVSLPLRFGTELRENRWYGLKLVSYVDASRSDRVLNRLYVDDDPFLADGTPRNNFRMLTEYVDRAGVSTGKYDTMVNWRGFVTTLRVDGVDSLDVALLSARGIRG